MNKITITPQSGLVLEGGGMRGVFTSGVLDCFMDHGIRFPYTIGVSAGACNGLSYMSGQRGRAKYSNIDMLDKYHFIGIKHLITKGNIMDFDLMFHEFPERIIPYDYEAYAKCTEEYEMVTTNCHTGKACYYNEKHNSRRIIEIVKASSSLPFVCPIAYVDGTPMLDGGITDAIPVEFALKQGYDKAVVVLTRNKGFRKKEKQPKVLNLFYKKYPLLQKALADRNKAYNKTMNLIDKLEADGKIIVIRPVKPILVKRTETDTSKLRDLYNEGYRLATKLLK